MDKIKSITDTYLYLTEVHEQTKFDYVEGSNLLSPIKLIGLDTKSLVKQGLLHKSGTTYKWVGNKPTYDKAYNYYYKTRGIKRQFKEVEIILNDVANAEPKEIVEALAAEGAFNKYSGIIPDVPAEMGELVESTEEVTENVVPTLSTEVTKLTTIFEELLKETPMLKELLESVVEMTIDNNQKIGSVQNSLSMAIAIAQTNQDNLFDIAAAQYYLVREQYLMLCDSGDQEDPKIKERVEKMGIAVQEMRKRVNVNVKLINKYGRGTAKEVES